VRRNGCLVVRATTFFPRLYQVSVNLIYIDELVSVRKLDPM
jgi:hypothetical protein